MVVSRQEYEEWLASMDFSLDQLRQNVPSNVAKALDHTARSLSVLEGWMLANFSSLDDIMRSDKYLIDRISCYLGETIRKATGGIWTINLSNREDVYYGLPVVKREGKASICPLTIATASLDRRSGTYMEGILQAMVR
jgi:hypothetical protein